MSALDLATPPELLLPIGLVLCAIAAILWAHERIQDRRARAAAYVLGQPAHVRGHRSPAARLARRAHGDHGSGGSDRRGVPAAQHALTDDEVVALARWFAIGKATPPHLERAVDKLNRRAADILNADRASRR